MRLHHRGGLSPAQVVKPEVSLCEDSRDWPPLNIIRDRLIRDRVQALIAGRAGAIPDTGRVSDIPGTRAIAHKDRGSAGNRGLQGAIHEVRAAAGARGHCHGRAVLRDRHPRDACSRQELRTEIIGTGQDHAGRGNHAHFGALAAPGFMRPSIRRSPIEGVPNIHPAINTSPPQPPAQS